MWIPQLPRALWWEHNAYYHRELVRRLPVRVHRRLAELLAGRAAWVDAVDRSRPMIDLARGRAVTNVRWLLGDVLNETLPLDHGMPVLDPTETLPEIRAAADECVPGALLRRRLFWRYTLLWRRPPGDR